LSEFHENNYKKIVRAEYYLFTGFTGIRVGLIMAGRLLLWRQLIGFKQSLIAVDRIATTNFFYNRGRHLNNTL